MRNCSRQFLFTPTQDPVRFPPDKMAALIRHGSRTNNRLLAMGRTWECNVMRHKSKQPIVPKLARRIEDTRASMASRGFLRAYKPYTPPPNVMDVIEFICEKENISPADQTKLDDPIMKFNILTACEAELNHSVPNSLLHTIEILGNLKQFYKTPVNTTTPMEKLKEVKLPKNLHVIHEYHRFHPETDTMFDGKTAFPKSSTIVTGLKYKKKYPGHKQGNPIVFPV